MEKVKATDRVRVHYTGKLKNGKVFDTTVDKQPLEISLGLGHLIKGFEAGLVGMAADEKKTVVIASKEAYGEINKELVQEIDRADLPTGIDFKKGMTLMSQNPDGSEIPLIIKTVKAATIVVDANHPLAGKELTFDLQLIEIL